MDLQRISDLAFKAMLGLGSGIVAAFTIYSVSLTTFIFKNYSYGDFMMTFGGLFYFALIYRGTTALIGDAKSRIRKTEPVE